MRACAAILLLCLSFTAAAQIPVRGLWRPAQPGDTPAKVLSEARQGGLTPFQPGRMQAFPGNGAGAWVVLQPQPPWSETKHRVVSIRSMPFERVTLYDVNGPLYTASQSSVDATADGFDRVVLNLPVGTPGSAPILLRFAASSALHLPVSMLLETRTRFRRSNMRWLTLASMSFGVMLAMGAMALCFALMLGSVTFAWYAGYIASYTLLQMIRTGFFFIPVGWNGLHGVAQIAGSASVSLTLVCAGMFMVRFCDLKKYAPVLYLLTLSMIGYTTLIALMRTTNVDMLVTLAQNTINPLLILGSSIMVISALVAALRGSRASLYFLAGWAPLLIVTALGSAQASGALPNLVWLNDIALPVAAIEAMILSVGLADRALNLRRDRDHVRHLADRDPLTDVFNRRAWIEEVLKRFNATQRHPQALLFMDLDHFKTLNDQLGHAAGDRALVSVARAMQVELRPSDILGRYGGEEFVVLLADTSPRDAMQIATRLRRRVHRLEMPLSSNNKKLTVSIGVAFARPQDTIDSLIERADKAMYAAKESGRDKVVSETDVIRARLKSGEPLRHDTSPLEGYSLPNAMPEAWRSHTANMSPKRDDDA